MESTRSIPSSRPGCYFGAMKKPDLIHEEAKRSGIEPETAADQVDKAVNKILRALRGGRSAHLPGLGTITPGRQWIFRQETHER